MASRAHIHRIAVGLAGLVGLLLAVMALLLFVREHMNRSKCASNLSAIGQCMFMYANVHHGNFPPDLGTLASEEDMIAVVFTCPDSDTSAPSNVPFNQFGAWVNEHSDYLYVGAGMRETDPQSSSSSNARNVLAYEKETNHHGKGMNVLFANGHVEWMPLDAARRAIMLTTRR